ncbi:MAG TPA: hypothetical protein VHT51_02265 [Micropepsaceae bacterium]|jgi:Spy/CpxP family protein refolding chaperone|nr:hypothetical protein [Micropepsaceae bacterium]
MKYIVQGAIVALALSATPLIASAPAAAATDFSITLGNAAFGYSDGYWDRDHHWHAWRNRDEARYFREHMADHYYNMRHNHDRKDRDEGWRNERWWDRH